MELIASVARSRRWLQPKRSQEHRRQRPALLFCRRRIGTLEKGGKRGAGRTANLRDALRLSGYCRFADPLAHPSYAARAIDIALHTFSGVAGMSICVTPSADKASTMALINAGGL